MYMCLWVKQEILWVHVGLDVTSGDTHTHTHYIYNSTTKKGPFCADCVFIIVTKYKYKVLVALIQQLLYFNEHLLYHYSFI